MKVKLNANETYYRHTVFSIGVAMLTMLLLMDCGGLAQGLFQNSARLLISDPVASDIAEQLFYAGIYLFVFMFPVFVLKMTLQKRGVVFQPMKAELRVSRYLPVIMLGGVFLIWTQAYINGAMVSIFNYSAFSADVLWEEREYRFGYQIVLQFIVAALVPAFCEEFLFRGAVLTNLLPFGRTIAILISALLFALMHQNAEQVFYAFAAGILLGLVYERTGSIWNCFFLHLANNFASVIMEVFAWRSPHDSQLVWAALEMALCVVSVGFVSALIFVLKPKKPNVEDGIFGRSLPVADDFATHPISSSQATRLFFSFPMLLFLALSVAQMVILIGMAWVYSYGA